MRFSLSLYLVEIESSSRTDSTDSGEWAGLGVGNNRDMEGWLDGCVDGWVDGCGDRQCMQRVL
jgi:hypothetical protein